MSSAIRVNHEITIPLAEIDLSYVRAGGPGGQNVNKVASKAVLRFDLRHSPSLPEPARRRALSRLTNRLTHSGELILTCAVHREQTRNRAAAIERLRLLLASAVRPARVRKPTRPTRGAVERRLRAKRARSDRKRDRRTLD